MVEHFDEGHLLQNFKTSSIWVSDGKLTNSQYYQNQEEIVTFLFSLYNVPVLVILCCVCFVVNILPLFHLLLRPCLWSTVNTFLALTLVFVIFHGCGLYILAILTPQEPDFDPINSTILKEISQSHRDYFCHAVVTLRISTGSMIMYLLVGCLFIRSMVTVQTDLFTKEQVLITSSKLLCCIRQF